MAEIPYRIQRQISKYEAVDFDGLRLFPVRVENYDEFLIASPAIAFAQQRLPVALMSTPLLQAYYKIEIDSIRNAQAQTGLFAQAMLFLALALKLGEDLPPEQRARLFRCVCDKHNPDRLKWVEFSPDGEEVVRITALQFQRLRPILAAQNGIELPDDDANPDLIDAESVIKSKDAPNLRVSIEGLVSSVAAVSGADESEIYSWPILKLKRRESAIKRVINYAIFGIAELQGTKWKNGNPVPHPWFDRATESSSALVSLNDFAGGAAKETVLSNRE